LRVLGTREKEGNNARSTKVETSVCNEQCIDQEDTYSIETLFGRKEDNRGLEKGEEEIENLQENCQIFKS